MSYHLLMYSTDHLLSSYYMSGTVLGDRSTDPPGFYVLAGETADIHLCTHEDISTL